jgi:uncharacterized protein involved in exopolysaccharide biosynthesis
MKPSGDEIDARGGRVTTDETRIVVLLPEMAEARDQFMDLGRLANRLWREKWIVLGVTLLVGFAGVLYAALATTWYRAEVILSPAQDMASSGIAAQLASMAGEVGLVAMGGRVSQVEPIAILRSKSFARSFIEKQGISQLLLSQKRASAMFDLGANDGSDDIRDAVSYFDKYVRSVSEDRRTGLVTLKVDWPDPVLASEWANLIAGEINRTVRDRALASAAQNIEYLTDQLRSTNIVSLEQSTQRMLEVETQKLMVARGNDEFAFRVIERADVPKDPVRPRRLLLVFASVLLGGLLGTLLALVRSRELDAA